MNRTTKILLAVGGIIVLSYPGIAWVTGIAIEGRIQHSEQQALDQFPYLTPVSREYHRGVYRSTEVATYEFRSPAMQALKLASGSPTGAGATITVESTIQHGPLPGLRTVALATVDSVLITPPALQRELAGALGPKPIIEAHTTIGLFGGSTVDLTSPAFSLHLPDGSLLEWQGLTSTMTITRNATRWSGQLSAPRLAFEGTRGRMELVGLGYSGAHEKAFDGLYLGNGTLTIERLDGSGPRPGANFSLQRVAVTSSSKADGDYFNLRIDVAADAASIAAVTLKNVLYSESFEHVHGPSFAAMMQAVRLAQGQAGANPARAQAGMQDALRQYGVDLLLHEPVLNVRQVGFAMPEGTFLLSARLSAPGLSRADLQWPAAVAALREHGEVTADLRVDGGLVQKLLTMGGSNPKVSAQLTSLEQQGYLTAGPAAVTTHLEYSRGKLTLNGHSFPPAAVN